MFPVAAASELPATTLFSVQAFVVRNIERLIEALSYYKVVLRSSDLITLFKDAPERSLRSSLSR